MSLYEQFGTNKKAESEGVWLRYGDARIKIARAGGNNKEYAKVAAQIQRKAKQHINSNETGDIVIEYLADLYVKTIILDWRVGL
jgi:hypothetical protein